MEIKHMFRWITGLFNPHLLRERLSPVSIIRPLFAGTMLLLFVTSCMKNEQKEYYSTIGMVSVSGDSTIITSDDGERLLVSNSSSISSSVKDKDRVIANFTLVDRTLPNGINYVIDVYSIEKVLFKPVVELTSSISDSIGNDEVGIDAIQVVKDFLNLSFKFYGNSKVHYINLIRYPGEIRTDTVNLEIRHNNNGDSGGYLTYGFVTFDLKSLQNNVKDSVVLHIKAKEFNDRTFEKNITYKY